MQTFKDDDHQVSDDTQAYIVFSARSISLIGPNSRYCRLFPRTGLTPD
jgi:hypothetical protein